MRPGEDGACVGWSCPSNEKGFIQRQRRFLDYAAQRQGIPHPRLESEVVRDYLTHLAVRQRVSASTQNQAFCAILFPCREVLGLNVESVSPGDLRASPLGLALVVNSGPKRESVARS